MFTLNRKSTELLINAINPSIKLGFLVILTTLFTSSFAQINQTIRGSVVDKDTKEPLVESTITVYHNTGESGTLTDVNGKYTIEKCSYWPYRHGGTNGRIRRSDT